MTKKSYARQQRDAAKEKLSDNKCWDELNQIYESAKTMLYQHTIIHTLAQNKELLALLENPSSTSNSIRILSRDLLDLNNQLKQLAEQHQGKSGGSQNPDEVWQSIVIGQGYAELMNTHTAVVQPTAFKILEDFNYAEQKLRNMAAVARDLPSQNGGISDAQIIL